MANRRTRKPIALSHGVKDPPTSRAIRQLEGVARDLRDDVDALSSAGAGNAAAVPTTRRINTAAPLTGGGDLSTDRTIGLGPIAEGDVTGLVSDLAAKAPTARAINTTAPLTGGGDLSADRTLAVSQFTSSTPGVVPASGGGTSSFLRADGAWASAGGAYLGRIVINGSGSGTLDPACTKILVRMVGGGGAGGGGVGGSGRSCGGGGSSGVYWEKYLAVSPGAAYTATIGAGGAGNSGANGNGGGATSLTIGGNTYTAAGGAGGGIMSSTTGNNVAWGGPYTTGSSPGDVVLQAPGDWGLVITTTVTRCGSGGSTPLGAGGGEFAGWSGGSSYPAHGAGGGGGGGMASNVSVPGGTGGPGQIIIDQFA